MNRPAASDAATRARMRRQRRRATRPEELVKLLVRELGHAYRLNMQSLPGSPDLSNQTRGWAVFVHGCYWHHHVGCSRATVPKRNRDWWVAKFRRNRARDQAKEEAVRAAGLRVMVIWECELRDQDGVRQRLTDFLGPAPSIG